VDRQEARFEMAKTKISRTGDDLSFIGDGILEFGDVSDFCGSILDREPNPTKIAAVLAKRMGGDWALSLRSRDGLAGKIVALLKDGAKIRGGGHEDAAALYFPSSYSEVQIRETVLAAIRQERERSEATNVTLGDLFKGLDKI
jgi:nanoRNase/pAp phosphatase (c-di-AMP/oligoRNAs hydrolase)